MISIVCSLSADLAATILQSSITRRLGFYRNFETVEDVFDHLWDHADHVDLVVLDRIKWDAQDLDATSRNRPNTRFVIVRQVERDADFSASNVIFLSSRSEIYEAIVSVLA